MSYIEVPSHPGLLVQAHGMDDKFMLLGYIGDASILIAAGLATADILAPRKKPGARRGPRSTDPEYTRVDRYYVVRDGQPVRRCRLFLKRKREKAIRLPGAIEALEAWEASERRSEAEAIERAHQDLVAALNSEREWEAAETSDQSSARYARAASVTLH